MRSEYSGHYTQTYLLYQVLMSIHFHVSYCAWFPGSYCQDTSLCMTHRVTRGVMHSDVSWPSTSYTCAVISLLLLCFQLLTTSCYWTGFEATRGVNEARLLWRYVTYTMYDCMYVCMCANYSVYCMYTGLI